MNVMYTADDNYAEIMGVSILSLLQNNREMDEIYFYIIEDKISQDNIRKLEEMIKSYNRNVFFKKKPEIREKLGVKLETFRWSDSAYSRLFLQEIFEQYNEVDKILYLDCDTLIVSSLRDLWETDITGYLGAACLECMSNMHKRIIGAKKMDNYVNNGMLLLNVKKWVEDDIQALVLQFIKRYKGKIEYIDQGVINGTISNQFKLVSPKYNLTTLAFDFTYEEMQIYRKPQFGYTKKEWEEAVEEPVVIHFTTSFLSIRPWYEDSKHPYAEEWEKLHKRSLWKENGRQKISARKKRERKVELYRKLPRGVAIRVAGILHAYVKPILFLIH